MSEELTPYLEWETPVVGDHRSFMDFLQRTRSGLIPTIAYGIAGTFQQGLMAPLDFQIPLVGGFTISTPWSSPVEYYRQPTGPSDDYLSSAQLAGQGTVVRTHTTGMMLQDYARDPSDPIVRSALEFVHPGITNSLDDWRVYGRRAVSVSQVPEASVPLSSPAIIGTGSDSYRGDSDSPISSVRCASCYGFAGIGQTGRARSNKLSRRSLGVSYGTSTKS